LKAIRAGPDGVTTDIHSEDVIDQVWRCTAKPKSSDLRYRVWRCNWRPTLNELRDALGWRDRERLEMYLEAEIE
jgi:hypothetical protein